MWETIAILASTLLGSSIWIKIQQLENGALAARDVDSKHFDIIESQSHPTIRCCVITYIYIQLHYYAQWHSTNYNYYCCFLNANMQSDMGHTTRKHTTSFWVVGEGGKKCSVYNECKWFFEFLDIAHIYTKLNMPILRANYVKVSRLSELAMFRNVYNQNENLYSPRALTYIV